MAKRPKSEAYPAELTTYGDHLRARRLDAGLSQRQAAEAIGVDETSVFNWESNRVKPAVRFIPGIIRFLDYCPYKPNLLLTEFKLIRQGLGYSQEKMAEALRIDEGTWKRWEAGERQPVSKYIERIKSFLDMLESQPAHGFCEENIAQSEREAVQLVNTIEFSSSL